MGIFSETPANPVLTLCDLEAISEIAKAHGAKHVVDSAFATPIILRPLDHGADMVIQSLTKYYEGHNMMVGGAVISKTPELAERIKWVQNVHGNIMNPFRCLHDFADNQDHGAACAAAERERNED